MKQDDNTKRKEWHIYQMKKDKHTNTGHRNTERKKNYNGCSKEATPHFKVRM